MALAINQAVSIAILNVFGVFGAFGRSNRAEEYASESPHCGVLLPAPAPPPVPARTAAAYNTSTRTGENGFGGGAYSRPSLTIVLAVGASETALVAACMQHAGRGGAHREVDGEERGGGKRRRAGGNGGEA
ncbi:hypothetical protein R3P38DRAFT_2810613 [Favolaschia claudopus]|uniref:Uncharacterized protein n=1 Tax=Favolaschia claudopus TaxID=2862362 RepID=A0AAV9ZB35_9AGAR